MNKGKYHSGKKSRQSQLKGDAPEGLPSAGSKVSGSFHKGPVQLFRTGIYGQCHKRQQYIDHTDHDCRIAVQDF